MTIRIACKLPRGIFYDTKRKRYRVRIHIKSKVVYLSYHKTPEDALKAYHEARAKRKELRALPPADTSTCQGMIDALHNNRL